MKDSSALYAFNKFGDTVLRAAYAMTGSYYEAEDITQEVFLTLHAKPQSFETDEHMKAWLLRSAINRCKNYRKSARILRNSPLDEALENTLSCEFTPRDSEIRDRIEKLPEKYAAVIFLYYYEEYTIKEILNTFHEGYNGGRARFRVDDGQFTEETECILENFESFKDEISELEWVTCKTSEPQIYRNFYVAGALISRNGYLYPQSSGTHQCAYKLKNESDIEKLCEICDRYIEIKSE